MMSDPIMTAISKELMLKAAIELDEKNAELAELLAALEGARMDLASIHYCDVVHPDCKICAAVVRIDAAIDKTHRGLRCSVEGRR